MLPPTIGHERRKDPHKVRSALLDATATLIAEQGLARVTVDAVAKAAGVTKGGLFHHFPSKQALIDGVVEMMIADADRAIAELMAVDPEPHGRFTRAMLAGVFSDHPIGDTNSARTLCLAMLGDPVLQQRWASWTAAQVERHAATDDNPACAIVRLAADGVWLSSLHKGEQPPPIAGTVHSALVAMTRPGP